MSEANVTQNSPPSGTETSLIGTPPAEPAKVEEAPEVTPQPPKTEGEVKPAAEQAPLTATDIKIPEGATIDQPIVDKFLGIVNNAELSPKDRAQALVDLQAEAMQAVSERGNKLWSDMQDKWQENTRTEFGTALEPMLGNISKLLDQYGGTAEQVKELRDVFTLTGAGNHPAMVRFLENVGKPLREGGPKGGAPAGGSGRSPEEVLYPSLPRGF